MFIIKIDSSLRLQDLTSIFNHLEVSSQTLSTLSSTCPSSTHRSMPLPLTASGFLDLEAKMQK